MLALAVVDVALALALGGTQKERIILLFVFEIIRMK